MIRSPRQFERALRPRVREKLRESSALWEEFKRARGKRRRARVRGALGLAGGVTVVLAMCLVFPAIMAHGADAIAGVDFLLAACGCWSAATACLFADGWLRLIWLSPRRWILMHMPIADHQIAIGAWRRAALWSMVWIYVAAWAFGIAGWRQGLFSLSSWLLAGVFCVGQWFVVVAAGTVLAARRPRPDYPSLSVTLFAAPPAILLCGRTIVDTAIPLFYGASPGGWLGAAWERGWVRGEAIGWIGLGPTAALLIAGVKARRYLAARYVASEYSPSTNAKNLGVACPPSSRQLARRRLVAWGAWRRGDWPDPEAAPLSCDDARRRIRTREFLGPPDWPRRGWTDRIAKRLLTPRDTLIVELLSIDGAHWTRSARGLLQFVIVIALLKLLFHAPAGNMFPPVLFAAFVSLLFAPWDSRLPFTSLPDPAAFPMEPRELASVVFKVALVRFPVALAATWICVAATSRSFPTGSELLLIAVPLGGWAVAIESSRSAIALVQRWELPRLRWRACFWLCSMGLIWPGALLSGMELYVLAGQAAAVGPPMPWAAIAFMSILLISVAVLTLKLCLFIHRAGHCDLRAFPTMTSAHLDAVPILRWRRRRRNRLALRQRHGAFWWLPRYMPALPAEESAA